MEFLHVMSFHNFDVHKCVMNSRTTSMFDYKTRVDCRVHDPTGKPRSSSTSSASYDDLLGKIQREDRKSVV